MEYEQTYIDVADQRLGLQVYPEPAPDAPLVVVWPAMGVPAPVRGQVIAAIGRIVSENADALARLVTREVGKPLAEARGEVQEIVDTCDFFLGEGRRLYGETVPSEMPDKQLFTFRTPVGVAAVPTGTRKVKSCLSGISDGTVIP